jgi:hypothetical protein
MFCGYDAGFEKSLNQSLPHSAPAYKAQPATQRHNSSPLENFQVITRTDNNYLFLLLHFLQQHYIKKARWTH